MTTKGQKTTPTLTQISGAVRLFLQLWRLRGGFRALFASPYFLVSAVLLMLCWHEWTKAGWWDSVTNAMPDLLGFTIGGFAMLLSFGDEKFKALLTAEKDEESAYLQVSAVFGHFIIVQVIALMYAIVSKAIYYPIDETGIFFKILLYTKIYRYLHQIQIVSWAFGYFLFLYAISLSAAAAMAIFRISGWFEDFVRAKENQEATGGNENSKT